MVNQIEGIRIVICIANEGNEASLEKWKIYQCLPDEKAERHNEIRVIDEEGEDYIYPADWFSSISLDPVIAEKFISDNSKNEQVA